jgi:hypothetical protein
MSEVTFLDVGYGLRFVERTEGAARDKKNKSRQRIGSGSSDVSSNMSPVPCRHNVTKYYWGQQIKDCEKGGACGPISSGTDDQCMQHVGRKT